ncbi:Subtilisin-like protease SBT1.5 [Thalictrum thalictroides]|uniref:Subtilisin-like protease SBT1.5 n=2 Tax=Thalictrum thalictroides TaxID=46969 RepID=A0A7J6WMR4_THATH|nr:Subtilisin-like protease SBT1.5 [Thalictrum thalictroides]
MYKVYFYNETYGAAASDTLAGMDQAIEDGVDLMSLSMEFLESNFTFNPILLGSLAAMEKGICVSCSAGNEKIVFCSFNNKTIVYEQMEEVSRAGAIGGLFATDSAQLLFPRDFNMPFVAISPMDGETVVEYLTIASEATVDIKFQITELGTKPAPQVAAFSTRGPDKIFPWVLKPDILAPGVEILAAWMPISGSVQIGDKYLSTDYMIASGTSMATPHAVGIAALLKSANPEWSSAAIRSAMMTTADVIDNANGHIVDSATGMSGTHFGSGHVNPNKALDPGLVYDINVEDYVNFLCATTYTSQQQKQIITGRSDYSCARANLDLNYPSFIVILNNSNTTKHVFKRVLTNVADNQSVYHAAIACPSGMKVVVEPTRLQHLVLEVKTVKLSSQWKLKLILVDIEQSLHRELWISQLV